jgi:hypothetical protein
MMRKYCRFDGTRLEYHEPTPFTPPEGVLHPLHCRRCGRAFAVRGS